VPLSPQQVVVTLEDGLRWIFRGWNRTQWEPHANRTAK
jgi:hypothetical protein